MSGDVRDSSRSMPPFGLPEREMLEGWLEFHRKTLWFKCEGLDDAARKLRPVPSSLLSLHGLLRHMSEVERGWFQRGIARTKAPRLYCEDDENADFFPLDAACWEQDVRTWEEQCTKSREVSSACSLDEIRARRDGRDLTLRWVDCHTIEEYARHNGHADLIREMVDGSTGC